MKEKLLALLVVAVMVASAFGAIGLNATKADAQQMLSVTLSSTNYYPSSGQQYTLSGLLTDSAGNAYKPIEIWYRSSGDTTYHYSNTIYTDANGKYSTTTSSSQTIDLIAIYVGVVGGHGSVRSNIVTINVQGGGIGTSLSLTTSNYNPTAGQQYTLAGRLYDAAGVGIPYEPIDIWYRSPGGSWQYSNTIRTDAFGRYSTTTSSSQTVELRTGFMGHGGYKTSGSNWVTITVRAPTLTLLSTNYNPAAGQKYTLYGYLKDAAGNPLADKPIDIFYRYVGGGWQFSNTVKTDANGKYSTTTSSSKTVVLQTGYMVNGVYVASSNVVTITQGGASATTLTLFGPDYTPTASALFTISGSLRDSSGNLLSGESIEIWIKLPPPASITDWQYNGRVTTGATGGYGYMTGTGLSYMDIEAVYRGNTALGYSASNSNDLRVYTYGGY
jgi:protocatechuate 3,4-dioxygenase beta subunit